MTNGSQENMEPDIDNPELAAFERRLRNQSLGEGPEKRDEILYQCGFAAGIESTRKQQHSITRRWRGLSIAASLLAMISISMQARSILQESQVPSTATLAQNEPPHEVSIDGGSSDSVVRLTELHRNRPSLDTTSNALSVSSQIATLNSRNLNQEMSEQEGENQTVFFPSIEGVRKEVLQPKDFLLILSGEA